MSILISLAGGLFHGDADGGSVFGLFLLLGALLGAGDGVLAVTDARVPASPRHKRPRRRLTCNVGHPHAWASRTPRSTRSPTTRSTLVSPVQAPARSADGFISLWDIGGAWGTMT